MKKMLISIMLILSFGNFAQNRFIELTNTKSKKTVLIKEQRSIVIKTLNGKTRRGKFTILDSTTIQIKKHIISLTEIKTIRKTSICSRIFMYLSFIPVGVDLILDDKSRSGLVTLPDYLITIPLSGLFGATSLAISDSMNKHLNLRWTYKIIEK